MTTEHEITKNAFLACRDTLRQQLGPYATNDDYIAMLSLMLHILLTENGSLGLGGSLHNVEVFSESLKALVYESQKDIKTGSASMVM
jgi:hypothetical protein